MQPAPAVRGLCGTGAGSANWAWQRTHRALPAALTSFVPSEAWGSWQPRHWTFSKGACRTVPPDARVPWSWQLRHSLPPGSCRARGFTDLASAWQLPQPPPVTGGCTEVLRSFTSLEEGGSWQPVQVGVG